MIDSGVLICTGQSSIGAGAGGDRPVSRSCEGMSELNCVRTVS